MNDHICEHCGKPFKYHKLHTYAEARYADGRFVGCSVLYRCPHCKDECKVGED